MRKSTHKNSIKTVQLLKYNASIDTTIHNASLLDTKYLVGFDTSISALTNDTLLNPTAKSNFFVSEVEMPMRVNNMVETANKYIAGINDDFSISKYNSLLRGTVESTTVNVGLNSITGIATSYTGIETGITSKYNTGVADSLCLFTESSSLRAATESNMFSKYNTDDSICVLNGGSLSYPARVELGFASKYNAGVSDSLRLFTESSSRRGRDISNMFDKYNTDNSIHVLNDGYLSSSARVELGVTSKYLKADNIGLRSLMGIDIPISTRGETGLLADYGMRVNDSLYVLKDYSGVSLEIGNKYSSINSIALEIENNDYMTRNNFGINSIINTSLTMEASAELAMSGKYSANTIFGTQLLTNRYNLNDYSSIENNIYSDTRIDIIMPTKQVAPSKTLKAVRHILEQHKTNFDNSHYGCTYEEQETEKEINITINYYFNGDLISTNMHIGSNIINKKLN